MSACTGPASAVGETEARRRHEDAGDLGFHRGAALAGRGGDEDVEGRPLEGDGGVEAVGDVAQRQVGAGQDAFGPTALSSTSAVSSSSRT